MRLRRCRRRTAPPSRLPCPAATLSRLAVRQRAVYGAECAPHPDDIDPAARFEADRLEDADGAELEALMQADRAAVAAVADHRYHLAVPLRLAVVDQRFQQHPPDSLPCTVGADIDRVLDGMPVGRARPVRPGVGIAD